MRGKLAKAMRRVANQRAMQKETTYDKRQVKVTTVPIWNGKSFDNVQWPSFKVTMVKGCSRAFYQWMKRNYKASKQVV